MSYYKSFFLPAEGQGAHDSATESTFLDCANRPNMAVSNKYN